MIDLAHSLNAHYQLQRIGYILETIEVVDSDKRDEITALIAIYLKDKMKRYMPLAANISGTGYPRCKKWKIIKNIKIESDL